MNRKRAICVIQLLSSALLVGCANSPRIEVDYSGLGQTPLDNELKAHWQTGTEVLTRDIQAIVDANVDRDDETTAERLEAIGAHCPSDARQSCDYEGVVRYRLFGLPDSTLNGKLTTATLTVSIQRQPGDRRVIVRKEVKIHKTQIQVHTLPDAMTP